MHLCRKYSSTLLQYVDNMPISDDFQPFRQVLNVWYATHKRDLPWRKTTNPYAIWISEIILQQTQVAQGLGYFERFMTRFPDVETLAQAPIDDVLKLWQGLGYYSRARNIHASAQQIMVQFGGQFPTTHKDILSLKGIGTYTAAAICSFSYKQPHATVDGNVYRVLARYFGIDTAIDSTAGKKEFSSIASCLLDPVNPDNHNQAMMEFGAIQCTPNNPNCNNCPLQGTCAAFREHRIHELPRKVGKISIRNRYFYYLYISHHNATFLHQRNANDIWQGLYEFPLIETSEAKNEEELLSSESFLHFFEGQPVTINRVSSVKKHILSHQHIYAKCIHIELSHSTTALNQYVKIAIQDIHNYPVSRLMEFFISDL